MDKSNYPQAEKYKKGFLEHKRVEEILSVEGSKLTLKYRNGKVGFILLENLLPEIVLKSILDEGEKPIVKDGVITWPELGALLDDENGIKTFYPLDLDPVIVWMNTAFV